ncbi:MAG TPA: reverse transcriptase/maturase family protein [Candidatus Paceibacterota bacterium]
MDNLLDLHQELKAHTYRYGPYQHFKINDPKPRDIHKASVRDRLVHHAIYRVLYPYFDKKFIADSYSCRVNKGTHRAMDRFRYFAYKVSKNHTKTCWVLKCDIRKFFASINHEILKQILAGHITDQDTLWLLSNVIDSFSSTSLGTSPQPVGLPLGNLTSQLLVNIYMNEFDQYVKHTLKVKYYVRYADDFVFFSFDHKELADLIPTISNFLETKLKLNIHPDKLFLKTLGSGVDFLGWVHFTDHRVLRTSTKRKMFRNLERLGHLGFRPLSEARVNSYAGILGWGNGWKIIQKVLELKNG